jgi:transketolase
MNEDTKKIRVDILEMVNKAHEGHIPSSFSIVELLYVIHSKMGEDDSFFLSKGHASAGLFAVLAHFGVVDKADLANYAKYHSKLGGHPHRFAKGVMASTGSLGHGFPIAAGYALAKKIKKEQGIVFCIVGDGETNEGTIWETAMYAEQLALSNLVCVIDENLSQVRAMTSVNIGEKFQAFGWEVKTIDGHNMAEIEEALFSPSSRQYPEKPFCVVAKTTKGKGIKSMEADFFSWHHKGITDEDLAVFKEELLA